MICWERVEKEPKEESYSAQSGNKRGEEVLLGAFTIINGERQDSYGNPEDNFGKIADLWNSYLGSKISSQLTPRDVALMMVLLKIARISTGTATKDSFVDAAGYIGLASDMK